jgi:cytochrome c2
MRPGVRLPIELIEGDDGKAPAGALSADEIGNAKDGRELFVSQGCTMCHAYEGRGGTRAGNGRQPSSARAERAAQQDDHRNREDGEPEQRHDQRPGRVEAL